MTNNCLVTKLKGVVDNPNITKLNEFRFKVIAEDNFNGKWLRLVNKSQSEPMIVTASSPGTFTVDNDSTIRNTYSIQPGGRPTLKFSNATYDVSVIGKYNCGMFSQQVDTGHNNSLIEIDIDVLKYSPVSSITGYGNRYMTGNINNFDKSLFTVLAVEYTNLEGTWDGFTNVNIFGITGSKIGGTLATFPRVATKLDITDNQRVYGSIDDLADTTNLTSISAIRSYNISGGHLESLGRNVNINTIVISELRDYSGFNGSVEAFVAAQVAAGRTTCTIDNRILCPWLLYVATFGGQKYQLRGYMYLTWDSASKITIYQGGTGGIAAATRVLAKGATQQEIAAWEQAGKTVTVIS